MVRLAAFLSPLNDGLFLILLLLLGINGTINKTDTIFAQNAGNTGIPKCQVMCAYLLGTDGSKVKLYIRNQFVAYCPEEPGNT